MLTKITGLLSDDSGATLVEYGLLLALIAVAAIVALTLLGKNIQTLFTGVAGDI